MKKLIYSIIAILVLSAAVCSAESYAPPEDNIGLWLKPESIAVDGGKRLDTWNDAVGSNDMSQATTTRKPTVIAPGNNILNNSTTVNFGINQYLESKDINYSGDSSFVIYYKVNNIDHSRYGISVGTKLGNAVFRNKYKRRIRMLVNNNNSLYNKNNDYIILLRKNAVSIEFKYLENDFNQLVQKLKEI